MDTLPSVDADSPEDAVRKLLKRRTPLIKAPSFWARVVLTVHPNGQPRDVVCIPITIHHRRHTFISHALAGGRTLAEVRDSAGHANVSITSGYLHIAVDDDGIGELFGFTTIGR